METKLALSASLILWVIAVKTWIKGPRGLKPVLFVTQEIISGKMIIHSKSLLVRLSKLMGQYYDGEHS